MEKIVTGKKILALAHEAALDKWTNAFRESRFEHPGDKRYEAREQHAWDTLVEIDALIDHLNKE